MKKDEPYNLIQLQEGNEDTKPMLMVFGKNLRKLRQSRGLTQEKLGELSGINYKYIGEIERGEKNPTAVVIYKLSRALGVSVSELFSMEEPRSDKNSGNIL